MLSSLALHVRSGVTILALASAIFSTPLGLRPALAQTCDGDINADGVVDGSDLAIVLSNWGPCATTIESVLPADGSPFGGTVLEIRGQGLGTTSAVLVGGNPCTKVSVVSPTFVVATTPAGSPGFASVSVVTSAGTTTLKGGFHYGRLLPWATVLEYFPDPAVITDPSLRDQITYSGFPWRIRDNASQIEMLLVPPTQFLRGCSPSDQFPCRAIENPVRMVTLTDHIYVGRYEVTQAQWQATMGSNPSHFQASNGWPGSDDRPVESVSWNAVQGFLGATGLRLLTEAEWERTRRAAFSPFSSVAFHSMPGSPDGTNDDTLVGAIAWFAMNAGSQTHPVGQKAANALGLYDMAGNVEEWTKDIGPEDYLYSATLNPQGLPGSIGPRVLRGGSIFFSTDFLRASYRSSGSQASSWSDVGFRAARTP